MKLSQRGGFVLGLIVGLLTGLALALAVALYVTKVPVPFVNKVPQRTPEQDAAEAERNRNWDPNAGLTPKPAPRPASAPAAVPAPAPTAAPTAARPGAPVASAAPARDPAAILAGKPVPAPAAGPAASAGVSAKYGTDPFSYFVQAGAYARQDEAEQQRAKLAMLGFVAKVTEREQSGRTVYRVRVGPFERKDEADTTKERLEGSGVEAALVRVQK
jgi:cell division protein FtsN